MEARQGWVLLTGMALAVACTVHVNKDHGGHAGQGGTTDGGSAARAGAGDGGSPDSSSAAGAAGESASAGEGGSAGAHEVATAGAAGDAGSAGAGAEAIDLSLLGCVELAGNRPNSTGSTAAPQMADLLLNAAKRGAKISGSIAFHDAQGDAADLIVQVQGSKVHYSCPLTPDDLARGRADFGQLTLNTQFPQDGRLIYFGVRDRLDNVSAYVVGTLSIDSDHTVDTCESGAFQLLGKVPSASTAFYQQTNGSSPDYRLGSPTGTELTIVDVARVLLDTADCSHLRLAGNEAGTTPVGWDNCMLVEYREHSGGAPDKAWYYCSNDTPTIYSVSTGLALENPALPSVAGTALDPQVPSGSPFGFPPNGLDLMAEIPKGSKAFELTLLILDFGSVGSTTDIWATASSN